MKTHTCKFYRAPLLLLLLPVVLWSQPIQNQVAWAKYLKASGTSQPLVETDAQNNLLVAINQFSCANCAAIWEGDTLYSGGNNHIRGIMLAKFSPDGDLLWHKHLTGEKDVLPLGFKTDNAGNLLTFLHAYAPFEVGGDTIEKGDNLLKFNTDGQLMWAQNIAGATQNYYPGANQMAIGPDNNILLGGSIRFLYDTNVILDSTIIDSMTYYTYRTYYDTLRIASQAFTVDTNNIYIANISPDGNVLWVRTVEHTGKLNVSGIACDADGKVYVAGNFSREDWVVNNTLLPVDTLGNQYKQNVFLMSINSTGNINWVKKYFDDLVLHSLITDPGGNLVALGSIHHNTYFGSDTIIYHSPNLDYVLFKTDSQGNYLWGTNESPANASSPPLFIQANSEGAVYLSGDIIPYTGPILAKYASTGQLLWLLSPAAGSNQSGAGIAFDHCGNLLQVGSYSGNLIIGSDTLPYQPSLYLGYIFLLKYADQSTPDSLCSPVSAVVSAEKNTSLAVFPNPATGSFRVQAPEGVNGAVRFMLCNMTGNKVFEATKDMSQTIDYQINTFNIPAGIYQLSAVSGQGVFSTKVVITH